MNSTLKLLSPLVTSDLLEKSNEELAISYQHEMDPAILATVFHKNFRLIFIVAKDSIGVSEQDLASYSLTELDKAMLSFNNEKGKFSTYYTRLLKNRLRNLQQSEFCDKRKAMLYSSSLEDLSEQGFDVAAQPQYNESTLMEHLRSVDSIRKIEADYCLLLLRGFTNNEISKILKVSTQTLSVYRNKLRKILPAQVYNLV